MSIQFTQFLLPAGRQRKIEIDRPVEIEALATELVEAGNRFEIEMLNDYKTISMTIEDDDEDGENIVRGMEIVENGPDVLNAIDKMVRAAHTHWQEDAP